MERYKIKPVPTIDPDNPPKKPKNRVLKFFPSAVGFSGEKTCLSTTFKRSEVGLRLDC